MADIKALAAIVEESGMTYTAIAKKTGIKRPTLYNRFAGRGEFNASEIKALSEVLHLTSKQQRDIFLR